MSLRPDPEQQRLREQYHELAEQIRALERRRDELREMCIHEWSDVRAATPPFCVICGKSAPKELADRNLEEFWKVTSGPLVSSNPELVITCEPTRTDV